MAAGADPILVTGARGLVGRAVVTALVAGGRPVLALVRTADDAVAAREAGADPVVGDLTDAAGGWRARVGEAGTIVHAALPHVRVPFRRGRAARAARAAREGARNLAASVRDDSVIVLASSVLVYGDRPGAPLADAGDPAPGRAGAPPPVGIGAAALAAEAEFAGTGRLRAVRLGHVYGPTGLFPGIVTGLRERRFRIVGDGSNPCPVVSAPDAADALLVAAGCAPGAYTAVEEPPPSQRELVHELCRLLGTPRPDVLPPAMASLSLGGGLVKALTASCDVRTGALAAAGWRPRLSWREDLLRTVREEEGSGTAGGR